MPTIRPWQRSGVDIANKLIRDLRQELRANLNEISDFRNENSELDDELRVKSDRIAALEREILVFGDQLKSLKVHLKKSQDAIQDLKNAKLAEKLESVNFQLQIAQNEIRDLKNQAISEREKATEKYEDLIDALSKQSFICQDYAATNRKLKDQVAALKAELEASKNAKLSMAANTEDKKECQGRE